MNDATHTEVLDLTALEVDGSLAPDQHTRLAALLTESPDARQTYLRYRRLHATLQWRAGEADTHTALVSPKPDLSAAKVRMTPAVSSRQFSIFNPRLLSLAAALLLFAAAAAVAVYFFVISPRAEVRDPESPARVATLIDATGDVQINDNLANPGGEYESGDYSIESGSAEVLLSSQVTVEMHGRTALTIHDSMHAAVARGSASFRCPPGAVGYTVDLPGRSRIVDLGTAFRVDVDDAGDALLRVDEGRVRWHPADAKAASVELDTGRFARIIDGRFVDLPVATALAGPDWPVTLDALDGDAVYTGGAVRFTGTDTPGPSIVRTLRSDYHRHDWTATFVFTLDTAVRGVDPVYIGVGPGEIDHPTYHAPVARPNVLVSFRVDQRQINVFDDTDTPALLETHRGRVAYRFGKNPMTGPHRLTIRWDAQTQTASCEYDHGDDGTAKARFAIDASDNAFTVDTARVFFGGDGTTLQRMTITVSDDEPTPSSTQPPLGGEQP